MNHFASTQELTKDHGVSRRKLVLGLDTLRFVTAMWVAFYHGARFPVSLVVQPNSLWNKFLLLIGNTTWNGTAAVAIFFLISGFLIHGSNIGKSRVAILAFWYRRGIRIGLPLLATLLLAYILGPGYIRVLDAILWTVYAELAYYALYPLLLPFIYRFGIGRLLAISLAISFAMIAAHPREIYLFAFGVKFTWLFNAPLWLMGCYLAEHRAQISLLANRVPLWALRCGVIGYCYASTILANHSPTISIGYTWTIWFFGGYCMVWLEAEMSRGTGKSTFQILERFGLAGYSLYLTHKIAIHFVDTRLGQLGPLTGWVVTLVLVSALAWIFYRLLEWPAHQLARSLGRVRRDQPPPAQN